MVDTRNSHRTLVRIRSLLPLKTCCQLLVCAMGDLLHQLQALFHLWTDTAETALEQLPIPQHPVACPQCNSKAGSIKAQSGYECTGWEQSLLTHGFYINQWASAIFYNPCFLKLVNNITGVIALPSHNIQANCYDQWMDPVGRGWASHDFTIDYSPLFLKNQQAKFAADKSTDLNYWTDSSGFVNGDGKFNSMS